MDGYGFILTSSLIEFYLSLYKNYSADQLVDIGCQWVILGHSERRHIIGEDDEVTIKLTICKWINTCRT
jgi:hypothetical protein